MLYFFLRILKLALDSDQKFSVGKAELLDSDQKFSVGKAELLDFDQKFSVGKAELLDSDQKFFDRKFSVEVKQTSSTNGIFY